MAGDGGRAGPNQRLAEGRRPTSEGGDDGAARRLPGTLTATCPARAGHVAYALSSRRGTMAGSARKLAKGAVAGVEDGYGLAWTRRDMAIRG